MNLVMFFEADLRAEDGHRGDVLCLTISEDGSELLSGGRDGTMRLWDLQQRTQKQVFRGLRSWVSAIAFAGDTGEVLSATQRFGVVRRWDLSTGEVLGDITHTSGLRSLACTNHGDMVFAGGADGNISVWNRDEQQVDVLEGHDLSANSLAVSADNAHTVSASSDATLLVWKTPRR